jgi:predicted metal-binding membrane protein
MDGKNPALISNRWILMMSAMMLPAVAPVALTYDRLILSDRVVRVPLFEEATCRSGRLRVFRPPYSSVSFLSRWGV